MATDHRWNGARQVQSRSEQARHLTIETYGNLASRHSVPNGSRHNDFFERFKIGTEKRIIIIEGISGAGKDTFQDYVKESLANFDVYDYAEGELLQSWKQLHIEGVLQLRLRFMKLFAKYMAETVRRQNKVIFLLNRFHLSTYVYAVAQHPRFEREYTSIVQLLHKLPVHVIVLLLEESQIEQRSMHPERSAAWRDHQRKIINKEGFGNTLNRHIWQQDQILRAVRKQQISYSLLKVASKPEAEWTLITGISERSSALKQAVETRPSTSNKTRRVPAEVEGSF